MTTSVCCLQDFFVFIPFLSWFVVLRCVVERTTPNLTCVYTLDFVIHSDLDMIPTKITTNLVFLGISYFIN